MKNWMCFVCAIVVFSSLVAIGFAEETSEAPKQDKMEVTLCIGRYNVEDNCCELPASVVWEVKPQYLGYEGKGKITVDDRITLVLMDKEKNHSPLIAKMSIEEAENLAKQLTEVIALKKQEAAQEK